MNEYHKSRQARGERKFGKFKLHKVWSSSSSLLLLDLWHFSTGSATLDFSGCRPRNFPFKEPQKLLLLLSNFQSLSYTTFWFIPFQTLDSRCSTWLHIKVDYQLEPNIIHLFPEKHNHQDLLLYHNIERPQTYRYTTPNIVRQCMSKQSILRPLCMIISRTFISFDFSVSMIPGSKTDLLFFAYKLFLSFYQYTYWAFHFFTTSFSPGSTLVRTSGQLKLISPNVESKVQQMMRREAGAVQQMGPEEDSPEITND